MLSRTATARVLRSLIEAELKASQHRSDHPVRPAFAAVGTWSDDFSMVDDGDAGLGLDSLEMMSVAAAINEMFHLYEYAQAVDLGEIVTFGGWLDAIDAAWSAGVSRLSFVTSGSTGLPKRCVHEGASLLEEARFLAGLFNTRRRIVALVPSHHIYGCLLTAFVADQLGVDVVPGAACSPRFLNSELSAGDLIVSFPDRWAAIDRTISTWAGNVEGVVSTAPFPPTVIASLVNRGLAGMVELYGSSETAGIGWRRHPSESFALMPHWTFVDGGDEADGAMLQHQDGRTEEVPDTIQKLTSREFAVGNRRDGAVQIGGINVWPQRVEAELERHHKVRSASVRLAHTPAGARLKAFIVPIGADPGEDIRAELDLWCRQRFAASERPHSWSFGERPPLTEWGKSADWPD